MTTVSEICVNAVRGCLVAAPGKKLVVADLSNIEGRVAAWLAGEDWKIQAFKDYDTILGYDAEGKAIRKGHDLYKIAAGRIIGKRPEDVTRLERQNEGKVSELACQFGGAVGAFTTMGANLGVVLPEDRVIEIVKAWRRAHPRIVSMWYDIDDAAKAAIRFPQESFEVRGLVFDCTNGWLRIRLLSGRYLSYPNARIGRPCERCVGECKVLEGGVPVEQAKLIDCPDCAGTGKAHTQVCYDGVDQYTKRWGEIKSYGGKFFENCITAGTLVLTDAGWLPIERITRRHRIWDGVEWVEHQGLAHKGVKEVIYSHGVWMTPDHKVLTTKGWVRASQSEGSDRAPCRLPNRAALRPKRWASFALVGGMCLREDLRDAGIRTYEAGEARHPSVMRLSPESVDQRQEPQTRYVLARRLRRLSEYDRSLPLADAPGMGQVRRAWDRGLRTLARILRQLLGGHGPDLRERADTRPRREQRQLREGQLSLDIAHEAGTQYSSQCPGRNALGAHDCGRSCRPCRDQAHDVLLPGQYRSNGAGPVHAARRHAQVYDLINCGPRRRFVVRSADGQLLIVHNCVQATARDIFMHGFRAAEAAGYAVVARVHDELITEVPDTPDYTAEGLSALMAANPPWSLGLPLAAAGHEMHRYAKAD